MPDPSERGLRPFLDALGRRLGDICGPSVLGALYFGLLSLGTFWVTLVDDRFNGVHAPALRQLVATDFRGIVLDAIVLMLSVSTVAGVVLGAAAGLVVRAVDRVGGRPRRMGYGFSLRALGLVVAFHWLVWLYDLALRPQLYEEWFYARGGAVRLVQLLATHWLGRTGVVTIGILLALGGLALALRPWSRVLEVLRPAISRIPLRRVLARGGAAAVLVGMLCFWLGRHPAQARDSRPNVVLIAADSLRADRVSREVAPHLTALAERGVRFDRASVPLPRTFPSWVSLLTGLYPHHHGIRHMFPRWESREVEFATVPRVLGQSGYRTAVITDFAGDIFQRADLGFQRVVAPTFNLREVVRERIVEAHKPLLPLLRGRLARWALPVLREIHTAPDASLLTREALDEIDREPGRPFLLALFYSTPHFPYSAPAPYYRRFADPGYRGRFLYSKAQVLGREAPPDEADVRQIRALFDGAVMATDEAVGELLDGLRARGLSDHTIVVFTADHGEYLYEPGRGQGHGDHLFGNEALAVPLVVLDPGKNQSRRVSQVVSTVDVAPTLCELAGARCPAQVDGRSLVPLLRGQSLPPRPVFAETGLWFTEQIPEVPPRLRFPYPDLPFVTEVVRQHEDEIAIRPEFEPITTAAKHRMVRDERYKLLYMPGRSGVVYELYDTLTDPQERTNVIAREPAAAQELRDTLWQWMLEDTDFERRGEYLLPRPGRFSEARTVGRGMRLEERLR
jgi:arylsulfatase A-like enzyme